MLALGDQASRYDEQVRWLNAGDDERWDALVVSSLQGTIFHTRLWLDALGAPYRLIGYFVGNQMRAGFAIGATTAGGGCMPQAAITPYLGPLYPAPAGKYVQMLSSNKEIATKLARFLRQEFNSVYCRFPPEVTDLQPFLWAGFSAAVRYTYRLSLEDLDHVFSHMDLTRRRNIKSAEKHGVEIETYAPFDGIMRMSKRAFAKQGKQVSVDEDAVAGLEKKLRAAERCCGFLARDATGQCLGAVWIVWDSKRAYYLVGGHDREQNDNSAVALAMWRAIQFTKRELGLAEFDFEGSMLPNVERFFRKFGGTLYPTYSIAYEPPRSLAYRALGCIARRFHLVNGSG